MTETINKLQLKIKKVWFKMLKAYAKGNKEKAIKLENKIIALELELRGK